MGCAWGSTPKSVCVNKVGSGRAALTTALFASLRPFSTGRCGNPRLRLVRCGHDGEACGGPWELWLLALFGVSYSAFDVAAGIFSPEALLFRAQEKPHLGPSSRRSIFHEPGVVATYRSLCSLSFGHGPRGLVFVGYSIRAHLHFYTGGGQGQTLQHWKHIFD